MGQVISPEQNRYAKLQRCGKQQLIHSHITLTKSFLLFLFYLDFSVSPYKSQFDIIVSKYYREITYKEKYVVHGIFRSRFKTAQPSSLSLWFKNYSLSEAGRKIDLCNWLSQRCIWNWKSSSDSLNPSTCGTSPITQTFQGYSSKLQH